GRAEIVRGRGPLVQRLSFGISGVWVRARIERGSGVQLLRRLRWGRPVRAPVVVHANRQADTSGTSRRTPIARSTCGRGRERGAALVADALVAVVGKGILCGRRARALRVCVAAADEQQQAQRFEQRAWG